MLDVKKASERLGFCDDDGEIDTRFVRRLVQDRRIRHYKVGRYILFEEADLENFICSGCATCAASVHGSRPSSRWTVKRDDAPASDEEDRGTKVAGQAGSSIPLDIHDSVSGSPTSNGTAPELIVPELDADTDTLTAALAYAKAGWYVLPVRTGSRKHPGSVVGGKWQHQSSRDPEQIVAWYAGKDYGIALHAGRSGLIIADVDASDKLHPLLRKAIDEERPPFQSTRADEPGRGHYLFRQPPGRMLGNSIDKLGGGWGELRGKNGVIILAPSVHADAASGARYLWQRVGPVPMLPAYVAELLPGAEDAEDAATDATVAAFLADHKSTSRPELLDALLSTFTGKVAEGESRHQRMVSVLAGAMKEARAGFYDARLAADTMQSAFLDAVAATPVGRKQGKSRTGGVARSEWAGLLAWAVAQANAADMDEVRAKIEWDMPPAPVADAPVYDVPVGIDAVHEVFRRWLGAEYDLDGLDVVLASAAVEQLGGDPVWLLMVSGAGNAKTETVGALIGAGAYVTSTISSEGALLSGTAKKERTRDATGGLLRRLGDRGLLVIKDFTSILSMNRDMRAQVLGALREVYDGRWERNVGTDGGRTLTWTGRIVLIGAVTTAYDSAHAAIASMGDRFALVRIDSTQGRGAAGRQALRNVDHETAMRAELSEAVGGLLSTVASERAVLTDEASEEILGAADLVTFARTAVNRDYQGNVISAEAPEMPTRLAKMLGQIVRGALSVGIEADRALLLAHRVAHDSMPPLRLLVLADVMAHPGATTSEVTHRLERPRATVDRTLQALHLLGLLRFAEGPVLDGRTGWRYRLSSLVNEEVLLRLVTSNVSTCAYGHKEEPETESTHSVVTDVTGDTFAHPLTVSSHADTVSGGTCPHGMTDGDKPDDWTSGRLSCPECAAALDAGSPA